MATELIWVFDHPFRAEDWPLDETLQEAMLDVVVKNAAVLDNHILQVVKLTHEDDDEGIPGHPNLDPKVWCMPGVVMYPKDELPTVGETEKNFLPRLDP